jgi:hypothetical protein
MSVSVSIAGTGERIGRGLAIEAAVRETVRDALSSARLSLSAIDMVVTVGSDMLDGGMVATRSGIAGAYGRELLTVPSSAGHALAAAMSMLESKQARTVLLVGWGEGTKFAEIDGRAVQADPFYARPVGASASAMAALQAQRLFAGGRLNQDGLARYGAAMRERAGLKNGSGSMSDWLTPQWSDGACALVLTVDEGPVRIADVGTSFRPYCPEPADLDPAVWVDEARAQTGATVRGDLAVVEAGGPTAVCEVAALLPVLSAAGWQPVDHRVNARGGGATNFFGPATGLRNVAAVANMLAGKSGNGIAIDLAGPIGQATTVITLQGARR